VDRWIRAKAVESIAWKAGRTRLGRPRSSIWQSRGLLIPRFSVRFRARAPVCSSLDLRSCLASATTRNPRRASGPRSRSGSQPLAEGEIDGQVLEAASPWLSRDDLAAAAEQTTECSHVTEAGCRTYPHAACDTGGPGFCVANGTVANRPLVPGQYGYLAASLAAQRSQPGASVGVVERL
jgi:hypothetical protein